MGELIQTAALARSEEPPDFGAFVFCYLAGFAFTLAFVYDVARQRAELPRLAAGILAFLLAVVAPVLFLAAILGLASLGP